MSQDIAFILCAKAFVLSFLLLSGLGCSSSSFVFALVETVEIHVFVFRIRVRGYIFFAQ